MNLSTFRTALSSKLGEIITPELAAWLESNAFDHVDKSIDVSQFEPEVYNAITIRAEQFSKIVEEIHPLHEAHWAETEKARQGLQLKPSYDVLIEAERAGLMLQFTARNAAHLLVGNVRLYLYTSTHTSTLAAREDVFFLQPEYRKGFTAIRFWQYVEKCLQRIGVREIYTDSKIMHDADGNLVRNIGRLNEFLGYTHVSNGYLKTFEEK